MEKLEEGMVKKVFQNARDNLQNMITMEIALRTEYIKEKQEIRVSISEMSDTDTSKNDYFSPRSSMKTNSRNELLLKKEQIDDNIKFCDDKLHELQLSLKELEIVEKFTYDSLQKIMQPDEFDERLDNFQSEKQNTQFENDLRTDGNEEFYEKNEGQDSENRYKEELDSHSESHNNSEKEDEINYKNKQAIIPAVKKILESKIHAIHHKVDLLRKLFKTDRRRTDIELEKLSQQVKDLELYLETLNIEKQIKDTIAFEEEQSDMENTEEQTIEEFFSDLVQNYNQSFKECNIDYSIEGKEKALDDNAYILLKNILQTSISNSYKIKKAKEILIKLIFLDEKWKLFILDDGMAYTREELKYDRVKKQKLNYKGIKKEVEDSKGEFKLESIEGEGTTICILLPYLD